MANPAKRQRIIQQAVGSLYNALRARGLSSDQALTYSKLALTRPGVTIGQGGKIRYQGHRFTPEQFAGSHLVGYVTGRRAAKQNAAAIRASPVFESEWAQAKAQRDSTLADVQEQQRRALLDWGDPSLVQNDPLLAAQAAANPFSTSRLIAQQYAQNQLAASQNANRYGTFSGGGQASGQTEASRQHAATLTDATTQLQDLLAGLTKTKAQANQAVALAKQQAAVDAYNSLLASGGLHAAQAPTVGGLRSSGVGFHVAGLPRAGTARAAVGEGSGRASSRVVLQGGLPRPSPRAMPAPTTYAEWLRRFRRQGGGTICTGV
jgi:hypothetical protein